MTVEYYSHRFCSFQLANTDASTVKVESKRKREVSDKEREQAAAKKQAKQAESDAIKQQFDALSQDKAHQAEARYFSISATICS